MGVCRFGMAEGSHGEAVNLIRARGWACLQTAMALFLLLLSSFYSFLLQWLIEWWNCGREGSVVAMVIWL
jgi:hypothetical protein